MKADGLGPSVELQGAKGPGFSPASLSQAQAPGAGNLEMPMGKTKTSPLPLTKKTNPALSSQKARKVW